MGWTDERVATLKELLLGGYSASQIAEKMGGVSRNAVIGKLHRLGLSGNGRPKPVSTPQVARNKGARAATRAKNVAADSNTPAPVPLLTPEQRTSVLHLSEKTCKWPMGDPGENDFQFCGVRAKQGSPYCEEHTKTAYQPLEKRRRANSA